jgi:hypothetical protein
MKPFLTVLLLAGAAMGTAIAGTPPDADSDAIAPHPENRITLTNNTGGAVTNYPLQFARPFVRGEVTQYPQLGICATSSCATVSSWLTTQADVKVRWDDGSAKHAILSILVPSLGTGSTYVTFRSQAVCNCGVPAALTKSQMLADGYDFDAQIQATQNSTIKTASARAMLNDWPQTTLGADITSTSATSITVTDGSAFPAAPFHILLDSEDMKVTGKGSGANWTVVRGTNGTAAATHANGASLWDTRVTYWTEGSVATTVVLADFSENHLYDFGWQPACVLTLSANASSSASTISVTDASCLNTPTAARLFRPANSVNNYAGPGTSEDVYICSKTGNTLNLGAPGCVTVPSIAGRAQHGTSALGFLSTDQIGADNAWQDPGTPVYNSVKPIFTATFWSGTNQVNVRVVAEIADTQRLQDQIYDVAVYAGHASPAQVYTQTNVIQRHSTWWTRTFWLGPAPPTIDIVHNVGYLASTNLMWNWDTTRNPRTSVMDGYFNSFQSRGTAIGSLGPFSYYDMGVTGGRPEIGPENAWFVDWLYTGYDKVKQVAFAAADLAGAWLGSLREGNNTKKYDTAGLYDGFGRPATVSNRKSITLTNGYNLGTAGDVVTPIGSYSGGPFHQLDTSHLYNQFMTLYEVTGDWWRLQSAMEWAHYTNMMASPDHNYGRGPTGAESYFNSSLRGMAWDLRLRAQLATFVPDDMTPEKTVFTGMVRDYLAAEEGILRFSNSYPGDPSYTTMYNWGRNTFTADQQGVTVGGQRSPMGIPWVYQFNAQPNYGIDATRTYGASSLFEMGYLACALGLARDMGLYTVSANNLLNYLGIYYKGAATDPSYNPILLNSGRTPAIKMGTPNSLITTWADMKAGYLASQADATSAGANVFQTMTDFGTDAQGGFGAISLAALASIATPTDQAWTTFAIPTRATFTTMNDDPRWSLMPRVHGGPLPGGGTVIRGRSVLPGSTVIH